MAPLPWGPVAQPAPPVAPVPRQDARAEQVDEPFARAQPVADALEAHRTVLHLVRRDGQAREGSPFQAGVFCRLEHPFRLDLETEPWEELPSTGSFSPFCRGRRERRSHYTCKHIRFHPLFGIFCVPGCRFDSVRAKGHAPLTATAGTPTLFP